MLKEIQENIEVASKKLQRLNENYHFLCKESRRNIDIFCTMHIEVEKILQSGIEIIKESVNEKNLNNFIQLVDAEHEIVFEPISG